MKEVTSASAFRADALGDTLPFHQRMQNAINDVADAVMAKGWHAVAYPEILAQRHLEQKYSRLSLGSFRTELLNRFAEVILRDKRGLADARIPVPPTASDPDVPDHKSLLEILILCTGIFMRHPGRVARAIFKEAARS